MNGAKETIEALDGLMREYGLAEATLRREGTEVTFRRSVARVAAAPTETVVVEELLEESFATPVVEAPRGTPVGSPINGVYYASPSPGSPPFVVEGDTISAGQPIALIESMKVFSEIPSPVSGTVLKLVAVPGAPVELGATLMLVG